MQTNADKKRATYVFDRSTQGRTLSTSSSLKTPNQVDLKEVTSKVQSTTPPPCEMSLHLLNWILEPENSNEVLVAKSTDEPSQECTEALVNGESQKNELKMIYITYNLLLEHIKTLATLPGIEAERIGGNPVVTTAPPSQILNTIPASWQLIMQLNTCLRKQISLCMRHARFCDAVSRHRRGLHEVIHRLDIEWSAKTFSGTYEEAVDMYQLIYKLRQKFLEFWKTYEHLALESQKIIPLQTMMENRPTRAKPLCSLSWENNTIDGHTDLVLEHRLGHMLWRAHIADHEVEKLTVKKNRFNLFGFRKHLLSSHEISDSPPGNQVLCVPELCIRLDGQNNVTSELVQRFRSELFETWSLAIDKVAPLLLNFISSIFTQWISLNVISRVPKTLKSPKKELSAFLAFVEKVFNVMESDPSVEWRQVLKQIRLIRLCLSPASIAGRDGVQAKKKFDHRISRSTSTGATTTSSRLDPKLDTVLRQKREIWFLLDKLQEFMNIRKFFEEQSGLIVQTVLKDDETGPFSQADIELMFREVVYSAPRDIIWEYLSRCKIVPKTKEMKQLLFASAGIRVDKQSGSFNQISSTADTHGMNDRMKKIQDGDLSSCFYPADSVKGQGVLASEAKKTTGCPWEADHTIDKSNFRNSVKVHIIPSEYRGKNETGTSLLLSTERSMNEQVKQMHSVRHEKPLNAEERMARQQNIITEGGQQQQHWVGCLDSESAYHIHHPKHELSSSVSSVTTLVNELSQQNGPDDLKYKPSVHVTTSIRDIINERQTNGASINRSISTKSLQPAESTSFSWPVGEIFVPSRKVASHSGLTTTNDSVCDSGYVIICNPFVRKHAQSHPDEVIKVVDFSMHAHSEPCSAPENQDYRYVTKENGTKYHVVDRNSGKPLKYTEAIATNMRCAQKHTTKSDGYHTPRKYRQKSCPAIYRIDAVLVPCDSVTCLQNGGTPNRWVSFREAVMRNVLDRNTGYVTLSLPDHKVRRLSFRRALDQGLLQAVRLKHWQVDSLPLSSCIFLRD